MKICLVNNLYFPFDKGGAEQVVKQLAKKFIAEGHDVVVISTRPYFSRATMPDIYYLRSFFSYLKYWPKPLRIFYHLWNLVNFINYYRIKKILKKEKPDAIITNNLVGIGFLLPLAIKKLNIKHIHFLHDVQLIHPSGLLIFGQEKKLNGIFCKIYYGLTKKIFARTDKVISPSKWLLNFHLKKGFFKHAEKKIKAAPTYDPGCAKKIGTLKKIVFVGQVEKHKGVLFLIELFNDLPYQLDIIGDGGALAAAKKLAKKNSRINFLGRLDHEAIANKLLSYDALVVPSLCYENTPSVIFEANQCGLPVIASAIGGIPEIVNPGNSLLAEPGNKKSWHEAFKKVGDNN